MLTLTPRQKSIFNRVVDAHIETAQPVASRYIASLYSELYRDTYSPATVRHEMGILEKMGYLTHPHTSAGRIPTDQGYRYYVDHGVRVEDTVEPAVDEEALRTDCDGETPLEGFAERLSRMLSELAGEVSLVLLPGREQDSSTRFFIQGRSRLLDKPEFQNVEKVRIVFRRLDERQSLMEWLSRKTGTEKLSIHIGKENDEEAFEDCTLITARAKMDHEDQAIVAVMGPRRMHYSKTVTLVDQMAKWMRSALATT